MSPQEHRLLAEKLLALSGPSMQNLLTAIAHALLAQTPDGITVYSGREMGDKP